MEDAKIAIEYLINVNYQTVSGRRDLVLHEEKFIGISDLFICERFFEAPLVAGGCITPASAGVSSARPLQSIRPAGLANRA